MSNEARVANLNTFRDCLSGPLISRSAITPAKSQKRRQPRRRKHDVKPSGQAPYAAEDNDSDAEELADFIDVGQSRVFGLASCILTGFST